jgi:hypothetical protein
MLYLLFLKRGKNHFLIDNGLKESIADKDNDLFLSGRSK